jgi:hypothetical protein
VVSLGCPLLDIQNTDFYITETSLILYKVIIAKKISTMSSNLDIKQQRLLLCILSQ